MMRARGLEAGYGEKVVLHALSFDVPEGVTLAVVGPGGSGKTALLKALARTSGGGFWATGELRVPAAPLPFFPQKTAGFDGPTARYSRARRDHLTAFLAEEASGYLLDEPEAGTRDEDHASVIEAIGRARGERTMVVVSHDLELVRRTSDLMMLLVDGVVVEMGETARVFAAPVKERTRYYLRMGS